MDSDELVSILKQKFQGVDREVIRAVLEDNDNRLAAAEEALRSVATRQGGSGTGPSGRPVRLSLLQRSALRAVRLTVVRPCSIYTATPAW